MKTQHPLAVAVLKQCGGGPDAVDICLDAARHGADSGFAGFTYYADTCEFARRHRKLIVDQIVDDADGFDMTPIQVVQGFRCLDEPSEQAVALAIYGGSVTADLEDDVYLVRNAMAWYALETVGNWFTT